MNGDVTVQEAMTRDFVGVSGSDSIRDTAQLLLEEDTPGAVVLKGQEPIGIVTAGDALSWLVRGGSADASVTECMTDTVPEVAPEQPIEAAVDELFAQSATLLVVTDNGGKPLGVLTQRDVIAATTFTPTDTATDQEVEPARLESEPQAPADADGGYSEQGICERCGALTSDLVSFNGQLLCPDCREV
ncbi:CBS domain-containing protein [Halapricum hydrolyticum]|uniref:CBS domain-containing protein n=1 Tax=Halapricum hydrolyticum TaxID=2979991 RepID=A0AAE3I8S4_9EURY|nr:CBS domain-containing protein [Halapricum hydrolyticum]MCU4716554.1 CBS domain-containing protein [Halapricum hydrolyticum]MCU4725841.1 CBS domain-containing protein [Halapricum hydrolyticum]